MALVIAAAGGALYWFWPVQPVRIEAESGVLLGDMRVQYAGKLGWVERLESDEDGLIVTAQVPRTGYYDVVVRAATVGEYKENILEIDGRAEGRVRHTGEKFSDARLEHVYLTRGTHEIGLYKLWGWVRVDAIELQPSGPLPKDLYEVQPTLVNPNADDSARRLMQYLCDCYGHKMLSGQHCDTGPDGTEITVLRRTTGCDAPAILELDMSGYTEVSRKNGRPSRAIEYAKAQWERGGIVALCWHWIAPERYLTGEWGRGFYESGTSIDLEAIMDGRDPLGYDLLMNDIDAVAGYLKELQEAGVPVLWRPLHEASNGGFWWGGSGVEPCLKLYRAMYDRMTRVHGLNNLIWVWSGRSADWYPGDEYVDILGEDIYGGHRAYGPQADTFLRAGRYTDAHKLIVLSENGCVPNPEEAVRDGILWGYFCLWQGPYITQDERTLNQEYNERAMVRKTFNSDVVVTLSELPDLTTYPLAEERQAGGKDL